MDDQPGPLAERVAALEGAWAVWGSYPALIVGALTLAVILFGIASFAYFRHVAKADAARVAEATAKTVSEQAANHYLQCNINAIVRANLDLHRDAPPDEADDIGGQYEEEMRE